MPTVRLAVLAGALLVPASTAFARTIDYSNLGPGNIGHSTTYGGVTAEAFSVTVATGGATPTFTLSTLVSQDLFARDESPGDLGLGVCSSGEPCGTGTGAGRLQRDHNENVQELIRLTLPPVATWVSLGLSSLDTNDGGVAERGHAFWRQFRGSRSGRAGL